jgi:hypothetical protein
LIICNPRYGKGPVILAAVLHNLILYKEPGDGTSHILNYALGGNNRPASGSDSLSILEAASSKPNFGCVGFKKLKNEAQKRIFTKPLSRTELRSFNTMPDTSLNEPPGLLPVKHLKRR